MTKFFPLRWLCALPLLLGVPVWANDSAFSGVSGTPKPMRGEHASIAMQSERVVITADARGYSTDVEFTFRNDGAATSVQMGFPETSYGDTPATKKSAFLRFASTVDGKVAPTKRLITSQGEDSVEAYWVKTVAFGARQTRRVRVSYRSPWGGNVEWGTHQALIYDFTGKNWRGQVERSDLEIRVAAPGLWIGLPLFNNEPLAMPLQSTPTATIFRKTWRNWQAQGNFSFGLTRAVPFWMMDRGALSASMVAPARLKNAVTFRVGAVPEELPQDAENPPAFIRDGVDYISLAHLANRLRDFGAELKKASGHTPEISLRWNPKTGIATLVAGTKTQSFALGAAVEGSKARPIFLRGQFGPTLYVPVDGVVHSLGLAFKADPKNRAFDLTRGTWTGK